MSKADKAQEHFVKTAAVISRDRLMRVEGLKELFQTSNAYEADQFDVRMTVLWDRLHAVARIPRQKTSPTFDRLMIAAGITSYEARQCLRILIDLGGEIEVAADPVTKSYVVILHN